MTPCSPHLQRYDSAGLLALPAASVSASSSAFLYSHSAFLSRDPLPEAFHPRLAVGARGRFPECECGALLLKSFTGRSARGGPKLCFIFQRRARGLRGVPGRTGHDATRGAVSRLRRARARARHGHVLSRSAQPRGAVLSFAAADRVERAPLLHPLPMATTARLPAGPAQLGCKAQERLQIPLGTRSYTAQYAPLYDARLRMLRPRLRKAAQRNWSARERIDPDIDPEGAAQEEEELDAMAMDFPVLAPKVLGLRPGQTSAIVGVVYASPPRKPDVLSELARELNLPPQPIVPTYTHGTDAGEVFLEDESGRIQLVGPDMASPPQGKGLHACLVTGTVVAALGRENKDGHFVVQDVGYPDGSTGAVPREVPHQPDPDPHDPTPDGPEWVALVAGLAEGAPMAEQAEPTGPSALSQEAAAATATLAHLRRELLAEWITGEVGSDTDRQEASKIVRLVVAGNAFAPAPQLEQDGPSSAHEHTETPSSQPQSQRVPADTQMRMSALKDLDTFLSEISCSMPVHVQPGVLDPVPSLLPQQVVHRALLPRSSRWSGLVRETNPAWIGLPGPQARFPEKEKKDKKEKERHGLEETEGAQQTILSSAGETVRDILKYWPAPWTAPLRAALLTLRWHHVAPTAPDTLWCVPITRMDPFVVDAWPDIYVVGGQSSFSTTVLQRMFSLHSFPPPFPPFASTKLCFLLLLCSGCRTHY